MLWLHQLIFEFCMFSTLHSHWLLSEGSWLPCPKGNNFCLICGSSTTIFLWPAAVPGGDRGVWEVQAVVSSGHCVQLPER